MYALKLMIPSRLYAFTPSLLRFCIQDRRETTEERREERTESRGDMTSFIGTTRFMAPELIKASMANERHTYGGEID